MKILDLDRLAKLIQKIKLYFLDKETFNRLVEYSVVPPEGIQLAPGASVLYILIDNENNGGIIKQIEIFLHSSFPSQSVLLMHPAIQNYPHTYKYVNNYFVEGDDTGKVIMMWKLETFYNPN